MVSHIDKPQLLIVIHKYLHPTDWIAPAIELEARRVDDKFGIHGVFRGTPRPELDEAWSKPVASKFITTPCTFIMCLTFQ